MLTPSERRILGILAVSAPLSCLSLPASALTIQDFHPNCDIRQLNLSRDQYESLRGLRGEYKQAVEKLNLQNRGSERPLRDNLLRVLSNPHFDERQAQRYVSERYGYGLQFALDELSVQHKFYHSLTPAQQRIWLQKCLY